MWMPSVLWPQVEVFSRGAKETNFSVSDRLVASTLQLEAEDEQVMLEPLPRSRRLEHFRLPETVAGNGSR